MEYKLNTIELQTKCKSKGMDYIQFKNHLNQVIEMGELLFKDLEGEAYYNNKCYYLEFQLIAKDFNIHNIKQIEVRLDGSSYANKADMSDYLIYIENISSIKVAL